MASYTVKEWFANKVANEVKRNISMCDIFCILRETEKAVYAVMNLGTNFSRTMWVPKSVLVEKENGHETLRIENYETAMNEFYRMWKDYI